MLRGARGACAPSRLSSTPIRTAPPLQHVCVCVCVCVCARARIHHQTLPRTHTCHAPADRWRAALPAARRRRQRARPVHPAAGPVVVCAAELRRAGLPAVVQTRRHEQQGTCACVCACVCVCVPVCARVCVCVGWWVGGRTAADSHALPAWQGRGCVCTRMLRCWHAVCAAHAPPGQGRHAL
jgi:hypothetical protein